VKMPRFLVRVGGQDFVVASKEGVGALTELLADALPVSADLHREPPEIELTWLDRPEIITMLQQVRCVRIPHNVVWKQKTKEGEVVEVKPVQKAPKALKPAPRKALRGPERLALPPTNPQLALL